MTDQTSQAVEGPLDATVGRQAARMMLMRGKTTTTAPEGLLFLPKGAEWAGVDAQLHAVAARYRDKAKLARNSAKRHHARGDLVRWRKACAVARVWEMAHDALWMVACPF